MFCVFRHVAPKLGMAKITQVDFPPRETVSYSKETQTPAMTPANKGDLEIFIYSHKKTQTNFCHSKGNSFSPG